MSKLSQVLEVFENAEGALSLPQVAHELDVTPERLDMMIQHWVRKGKIVTSDGATECGSCGSHGSCPFIMDMPQTYELASKSDFIPLAAIGTCQHKLN